MSMEPNTHSKTNKEPLAYKVRDAAYILGVPASTLRKRIREGEVDAITALGPWLITRKEIERILECTLRNSNGKAGK